jgi:hypothetical protein
MLIAEERFVNPLPRETDSVKQMPDRYKVK